MAGYTQSTRTRGPSKKKVLGAVAVIPNKSKDISIRKIENGNIVRVSGETKTGYESREFFVVDEAEAKKLVGDLL